MNTPVFLYGTLRDADLRRVVLGAAVEGRPAALPDHAVRAVPGASHPALCEAPGEAAPGEIVTLSGAALERLAFYEACFGYEARDLATSAGAARVYAAAEPMPAAAPWDFEAWRRRWGVTAREAAREVLDHHGREAPDWVRRRWTQIGQRADAAARAAKGGPPQDLRRGFGRADVEIVRHARPFTSFFSVVEQDLRFRRFDGSWSETVSRSALVSGDAVTVLPYDPARDVVLLVEQFRYGPWARGDRAPWAIEPIAGRIDPGEGAEATARREAREEAEIEIDRLEHVGSYYASTGCLSEYVISYVGICSLAQDDGGGVSGAHDEDEDILSHVIPFDRLMRLVATGEAEDAPLLISAWWLSAHRDRLRRG